MGAADDFALGGIGLSGDMKIELQNKLGFVLHAIAAAHERIGYCQGMDYVVAHLLRVLQDTILLRVIQRSMSAAAASWQQKPNQTDKSEIHTSTKSLEVTVADSWRSISSDELRARMSGINSQSVVVEEVVFNVMDTFFSVYNLQHMYWPE